MASSPYRRRQRSARVTVAVGLLALATLAVLAALPTQSPGWLSTSSVLALVCGATASRIIYSELLQSRRESAADRAAQAKAYREMFTARATEHAEFTTAMTDRLASRERSIRELESTVLEAEGRAMDAEQRVQRESRRANEAQEELVELRRALEARRAEQSDELAVWDSGTMEDLMAWEDQAAQAADTSVAAAGRRHG